VALDKFLPTDLLQVVDFNRSPGILAVRKDGVIEYLLYDKDQKIVGLLLLHSSGSISFQADVDPGFRKPPSVPTIPKKTVPPQLATLGITLDSRLQLLSVKDGVGIYRVYNIAQGIVCCMKKYSDGNNNTLLLSLPNQHNLLKILLKCSLLPTALQTAASGATVFIISLPVALISSMLFKLDEYVWTRIIELSMLSLVKNLFQCLAMEE
jgi:hypothetical protein